MIVNNRVSPSHKTEKKRSMADATNNAATSYSKTIGSEIEHKEVADDTNSYIAYSCSNCFHDREEEGNNKQWKRNDWVRLLTGVTILATIACAGFFPFYFFHLHEEKQAESSVSSEN